MNKNLYTINKKVICIKIPIETDECLRKFILDNAYMRNKIRNDFVEEANKYKGDYNMYNNFNPSSFKTRYYNEVEVPEKRYDYYCTGLSEQVSSDIFQAMRMLRTKNMKVYKGQSPGNIGEFKFKQFDYNRYSFRVKLKPTISEYTNKVRSRLKVVSNNIIKFTSRTNIHNKTCNRVREEFIIKLKEPLYDDIIKCNDPLLIKRIAVNNKNIECMFYQSDIKDISFLYEYEKYYILLFANVTYLIDKSFRKYSKNNICGIDTGIRHPVTLHDGNKTMYLSMDDKTTRKIHYLERRIGRLNKIMCQKMNYNEKHLKYIYSNNVLKVIHKIQRIYHKIANIKNDWIKTICKQLTTLYNCIVVDTFTQPRHDNSESKDISKVALRKINYANRFHKMYYFNEFLKHDAIKYGCKYIKSPEDTTRTCSICKHINPHLKLSDKYLKCERCGNVIERDENAAKNCYDYALEKSKVI